MSRQKYDDSVNWLGIKTNEKLEPATYHGNYFVICKKCSYGINHDSKIGRHIQYRRNGDFVIQLQANQINHFKRNHNAEGHNWTILHESVVPKYVQHQMIGDKKCLIIAV